jgi:hypothetical protein
MIFRAIIIGMSTPLSLKVAAKIAGVRPDTLRKAIYAGALAGIKIGPILTVDPDELQRYIMRDKRKVGRPKKQRPI